MKRTALGLSLLLVATVAQADFTAAFFEQGSGKSKKLFTSEQKTESQNGVDKFVTQYKDLDGTLLFEEKGELEGSKIKKVEIAQKQLGQTATVEVKDGKIHFTKTSEGKTKTSDEKLKDTFVMSPNFQRFVRDNWSDLSSGKTVDFRYGVWDRMETVGFSLFKIGDEEIAGQKAVVLKMKPSSFLIAALVKPILFKFAADGSKLLELNGRVPVKQKSGDSFKDLDAEAVYTHL
jgi:hypothetical protein